MKENKLFELSMDFSVDIINLVKHLKYTKSLFSFIVAPPFPILYHKFICLSNDASPAAI